MRQGAGEPSREDLVELVELLGTVHRQSTDLESRLFAIENSRFFRLLRLPGRLRLRWKGPGGASDYRLWLEREQVPVPHQLQREPLVSVLLPPGEHRETAESSLRQQTYPNWDLCAAGSRLAGEYIAFLGHGDTLAPCALHAAIAAIVEHKADLLYTDEDHFDRDGRRNNPVFKPAWSPDLLRCLNYTGGLLVVRRELLEEAGWQGGEE